MEGGQQTLRQFSRRRAVVANLGIIRPVNLTSQIGKIFERLIRDKNLNFSEENNKLRDSQLGFRKRRSCLKIEESVGIV